MGKTANTQTRFPEETYQYIQQEAAKLGISQNSFILVLLQLGQKVWDSKATVTISGE